MTLSDYIAVHLTTPFKWGEHDCVLFAAGWVRETTGLNPLVGIPAWQTERQALRTVRAVGGLERALDVRFVRISPSLAPDGAIALRAGALCLFSGAHLVGAGPGGLTFIDRTEAEGAWASLRKD